jgi:thiol-disulfide isomerase/thioredoxin
MISIGRIACFCATAFLVAACGGSPRPASTTPQPASASGGPTLAGNEVSISKFRGHPVVLIFWASWCGPCHDEQPALNSAYRDWSPLGVDFMGIDLRDDDPDAIAYERQLRVPYQSIVDGNATIAVYYRIPAAPAIVFLDAHGVVADTALGGLGTMSAADFNAEITTLLAATTSRSA